MINKSSKDEVLVQLEKHTVMMLFRLRDMGIMIALLTMNITPFLSSDYEKIHLQEKLFSTCLAAVKKQKHEYVTSSFSLRPQSYKNNMVKARDFFNTSLPCGLR